MRKAVVGAAKVGKPCVFNYGKIVKDMTQVYKSDEFPSDKIFDFATWRDPANYKSIVKDDEDVDVSGNTGQYVMQNGFTIFILFDYESDEKIAECLAAFPH